MSTWTYIMNIKGQGHSVSFVQGHSDSTFANFFSLEKGKPFEAKFHVEPPGDGGTKVCSNGPGHMTNMATTPYMLKTLKKSSFSGTKNRWPWKWVASGARVLPSLFKCWPWLTLTYFTARSDLVPDAFVWEKGKTMDFFRNCCSVWCQTW